MECTLYELLTCRLAASFNDGEVGFTGLATGSAAAVYITGMPLAAMQLAQKTHAPNLTVLLAGWNHNPDLSGLGALPDAEYDNALLNLPSEAHQTDYPGPWAHRAGDISFAFGSGVQIDREGNINSTCIGDAKRPAVQLVGPIFLLEHMSVFGREYIMMPRHELRGFVERVDHISGVGYPGGREGRRALGLEGGGPCAIYTPKCIFAFSEAGEMYVESIHPGVDRQDVMDSTGFPVGSLRDTPETPLPSAEILEILRRAVDPRNILLPAGPKV